MTPPDPGEVHWRYTFCDLVTRLPLARLPLVDADLSEVIGGPAEGGGAVPLGGEEVRKQDPWAATQQRRSICFAERVTVIRGREESPGALWAGIVWKRERSGRSLALRMATPESYLAQRLAARDRALVDTDDAVILRTLLDDAQQVPGGSIGLALPANMVNTRSDLTVTAATEERSLLEIVQAGAHAAPMEWRIVPGGTAETGFTLTVVAAPRLGSTNTRHLVWVSTSGSRVGNEVIGYQTTEDGTGVPNELRTSTELDDGTELRSTRTSGEVDAGYPLLQAIGDEDPGDATTQARLDQINAAELARRRREEVRLTGLTVAGDRGPVVTSYGLGDAAVLDASDLLWPRPTRFTGRIVGRRIRPAQPGRGETVTMTIGVT